jgi:hypothetical protein
MAQRLVEVAGREVTGHNAGIAGLAIACGVSEDDWKVMMAEAKVYDTAMENLSKVQAGESYG